ncbi:unnamed protein product [Amoebophrya sp. A25]|nr:unnamed protein product [Amoebophrya sp. A25]|eukprot:GSA25T00016073001.1
MNAKSSRAHTLFLFSLDWHTSQATRNSAAMRKSRNSMTAAVSTTIWIVDLAGRENEKTTLARGERLVELGYINKSLFHLSTCIQALGRAAKHSPDYPKLGQKSSSAKTGSKGGSAPPHPPTSGGYEGRANFRNSKVTMLLQNALSGNSRTFMLGTLTPAESGYDENLVTLRFAATVKNIRTHASRTETVNKDATVRALEQEVAELRADLAQQRKFAGTDQEVAVLHESLDAAEAALAQRNESFEALEKRAKELQHERSRALWRLGMNAHALDITGIGHSHRHSVDHDSKSVTQSQLRPIIGGAAEQASVFSATMPVAPWVPQPPLLRSEHADPSRCGVLQYSLARMRSFYFGDSLEACQTEAKRRDEFEVVAGNKDAQQGPPGSAEGLSNCAELRGLGMAPTTVRVARCVDQGESRSAVELTSSCCTMDLACGDRKTEVSTSLVTVTRLDERAEVRVNNLYLAVNEESEPLKHGDKITLGRSYVFRVYLDNTTPFAEAEMTHTPRGRRSMFATAEETASVLEKLMGAKAFGDTYLLHQAKHFVSTLRKMSIDHEEKVRKYLYEAVKVHSLVAEAQEITDLMRPNERLQFALVHSAPVVYFGFPEESFLPGLCVRVARKVTKPEHKWRRSSSLHLAARGEHLSENLTAPLNFEHHHHRRDSKAELMPETLYVWTVSKFVARLDMMRDLYHTWQQHREVSVDLTTDPWVEAGPVEIEFWLEKHAAPLRARVEELEQKSAGQDGAPRSESQQASVTALQIRSSTPKELSVVEIETEPIREAPRLPSGAEPQINPRMLTSSVEPQKLHEDAVDDSAEAIADLKRQLAEKEAALKSEVEATEALKRALDETKKLLGGAVDSTGDALRAEAEALQAALKREADLRSTVEREREAKEEAKQALEDDIKQREQLRLLLEGQEQRQKTEKAALERENTRMKKENDKLTKEKARLVAENERLVREKRDASQLRRSEHGASAQLLRCMELSKANQKMLDEFLHNEVPEAEVSQKMEVDLNANSDEQRRTRGTTSRKSASRITTSPKEQSTQKTSPKEHSTRATSPKQKNRTTGADQSIRITSPKQSTRTSDANQGTRITGAEQRIRTSKAKQSTRTTNADQSTRMASPQSQNRV